MDWPAWLGSNSDHERGIVVPSAWPNLALVTAFAILWLSERACGKIVTRDDGCLDHGCLKH
jgi:hypothetical protein